jgi:hypothetical protein
VTLRGLGLMVLGLAMIGLGSAVAKRKVVAEYGTINAKTREQAEDEGIVPGWATAMVLLGYLGVIVGFVLAVIGLFRG